MINTIFFDLDGTLLPLNTEEFTMKYFDALARKLKDYFTPEEVGKVIWSSTAKMIQSDEPHKTNQDVFFEDFFQHVDIDKEVLEPLFDEFYDEEFTYLQEDIKPNETMIESVNILKNKGYNLVIATNPLFPKVAILERVQWAGLDKDDFEFITSYETMHYAKPRIGFYQELLEKTGSKGSKTMMVGNDVHEDMIAKDLNMTTFLIEDFIIGDLNDNENIDYHGSYHDFHNFCKKLPDLKEQ